MISRFIFDKKTDIFNFALINVGGIVLSRIVIGSWRFMGELIYWYGYIIFLMLNNTKDYFIKQIPYGFPCAWYSDSYTWDVARLSKS